MTRELAWQLLRSGSETPLRDVDRTASEAGLDARDRGLLRRIIGTEVRRRGTLRALVRHFASGRPDADLAAFLHVGLVQLLFLDQIPDHAAVNTTVEACRQQLGPKRAAYVNAVLRKVIGARVRGHVNDPRCDLPLRELALSEPVFPDPAEHPLLWAQDALSMPVELMRRWVKRYGEERAFALASSALEEPDLSLRILEAPTALESSRESAPHASTLDALAALDVPLRPGGHPAIQLAPAACTEAVLRSEPFARGLVTVQGETALRAAELVEARAGERVLDLCAAPGGKTAVLAQTGATVVATDASPERLARLHATIERLALGRTVEVASIESVNAQDEQRFDAVLVDVPCSNTGVLAQRPEARWRFGTASQHALATIQVELLRRGARNTRPGGRLVYATCSIEPEENHRRVVAFLEAAPDFELEHEIDSLPDPRGAHGPVDGGYAARLRRRK